LLPFEEFRSLTRQLTAALTGAGPQSHLPTENVYIHV